MRAPLQLGWSPSLLSRPGLVLFVGESQKSTNSIFWEGQKTVFNQQLSCENLLYCSSLPLTGRGPETITRCQHIFLLSDLHAEAMLRLVTSDCFILTSFVPTWITLFLYSLHSGDLYYYLYLLVAQMRFHPFLHLNYPCLTIASEAGLAAWLSLP
jgi:hypothetical protein